jgi:hypothetical protein
LQLLDNKVRKRRRQTCRRGDETNLCLRTSLFSCLPGGIYPSIPATWLVFYAWKASRRPRRNKKNARNFCKAPGFLCRIESPRGGGGDGHAPRSEIRPAASWWGTGPGGVAVCVSVQRPGKGQEKERGCPGAGSAGKGKRRGLGGIHRKQPPRWRSGPLRRRRASAGRGWIAGWLVEASRDASACLRCAAGGRGTACPVRLARSLKSSFPCPLPVLPPPPAPSAHNSQGWIQKRKHVATKAPRAHEQTIYTATGCVCGPYLCLTICSTCVATQKSYGYTLYSTLPHGTGPVSPSIRGQGARAPSLPARVERVVHAAGARRHALAGLPLPPAPMHPVSGRRGPGSGRIWPLPGRGGSSGRPRPRLRTTAPGRRSRCRGARSRGRATCQCDAATGQDWSVVRTDAGMLLDALGLLSRLLLQVTRTVGASTR